jgi:hypothetical protein
MSRDLILNARTEVLAVAPVSSTRWLDRAGADAAIASTVRTHHGTRGCLAELAARYGDAPEVTAGRIKWARTVVAELYPPPALARSLTAGGRHA